MKAVQLSTKDVSPASIAALGVGGHAPAPVFVDSVLEPLCPVMLWSDHRSEEQRERILMALGRSPANGPERLMVQTAARAMWLRCTQPRKLAQTRCIMHSGDYLVARLTGQCIMTGVASPEIFSAAGLSLDLLPKSEFEAGEVIGGATPDAAEQLGLHVGMPVVTGGLDSFLASFGSGICEPGDACLSTGSSSIVALLTRSRKRERFRLGGYSLLSQPVRLGARTLSWAQECTGQVLSLPDVLRHATDFCSPVLNQDILTELLQAVEVGDHEGCGLFSRLSQRHSGVEIFRLLLEAIMLRQRQVLDELQEDNATALRVCSVGGLAAYPEFNQLQADVLGRAIEVPKISESGTLGAAMLGAMALGLYDNHKQAASRMVGRGKVYQPRQTICASYDALFREICFQ